EHVLVATATKPEAFPHFVMNRGLVEVNVIVEAVSGQTNIVLDAGRADVAGEANFAAAHFKALFDVLRVRRRATRDDGVDHAAVRRAAEVGDVSNLNLAVRLDQERTVFRADVEVLAVVAGRQPGFHETGA